MRLYLKPIPPIPLLALLIAASVGIALKLRFGTDDAFISFVFSRSLARGEGLTWFGEHIEGYTNFLWVLWVSLGIKLGSDPLVWAWAGSIAALCVVSVATYNVAWMRTRRAAVALAAVAMLSSNYSYLAYGTSGLETMLQTAFVVLTYREVESLGRTALTWQSVMRFSLFTALALLTRLDSAVLCGVFWVALLQRFVSKRATGVLWAVLVLPPLIVVGSWFAWKLSYYGHVLPNTYFAKAQLSVVSATQGLTHLGRFLSAYWLWPVLTVGLALGFWRKCLRSLALPLATLLTWFGYVVFVGGDFMEYRFFVPILPLLFVSVAELFALQDLRRPVSALPLTIVCLVLGAASVHHAQTFLRVPDRSIDSIKALRLFHGLIPNGDWGRLGRPLNQVLSGSGALLSCNGVGAIPYYADLPTVDQLGLVDPWVARHGARPSHRDPRPGHQRFAPLEYLKKRGVNLVIGSPTVVPRGFLNPTNAALITMRWPRAALGAAVEKLSKFRLIAVPVEPDSEMLVWYLTPTSAIDARLSAAGWHTMEFPVPE